MNPDPNFFKYSKRVVFVNPFFDAAHIQYQLVKEWEVSWYDNDSFDMNVRKVSKVVLKSKLEAEVDRFLSILNKQGSSND